MEEKSVLPVVGVERSSCLSFPSSDEFHHSKQSKSRSSCCVSKSLPLYDSNIQGTPGKSATPASQPASRRSALSFHSPSIAPMDTTINDSNCLSQTSIDKDTTSLSSIPGSQCDSNGEHKDPQLDSSIHGMELNELMALCSVYRDRVVEKGEAQDISALQRINDAIASRMAGFSTSASTKDPVEKNESTNALDTFNEEEAERHFFTSLKKKLDYGVNTHAIFGDGDEDTTTIDTPAISLVPANNSSFLIEDGEGVPFSSELLKNLEVKPVRVRRKGESDSGRDKRVHVQ